MEKRREEELFYNLRMPKIQEIFTTVAIVCHPYERLAFLQNVFAIILLWVRKDVENFSKKLYTSKIKKKRIEAETKYSVWDLR